MGSVALYTVVVSVATMLDFGRGWLLELEEHVRVVKVKTRV